MNEILSVNNISVHYSKKSNVFSNSVSGVLKAVDQVSFGINKNEIFGLVGESGSGKSTIGNCILGTVPVRSGDIIFDGKSIKNRLVNHKMKTNEPIEMIYQDPNSSLCPTMTIGEIIEEPMKINTKMTNNEISKRRDELLDLMDLSNNFKYRYPHQLSGGQKQRVAVARAMALKPKLIIADEPTSALDVSVQARLLNLFLRIKKESNVSILFISHNLIVVRHISDRIAVMKKGKIVETGIAEEVFSNPQNEYTKKLVDVIPLIRR